MKLTRSATQAVRLQAFCDAVERVLSSKLGAEGSPLLQEPEMAVPFPNEYLWERSLLIDIRALLTLKSETVYADSVLDLVVKLAPGAKDEVCQIRKGLRLSRFAPLESLRARSLERMVQLVHYGDGHHLQVKNLWKLHSMSERRSTAMTKRYLRVQYRRVRKLEAAVNLIYELQVQHLLPALSQDLPRFEKMEKYEG